MSAGSTPSMPMKERVFVKLFAATSEYTPKGAVKQVNEELELFFGEREIENYVVNDCQVTMLPTASGASLYLAKVIVYGTELIADEFTRSGEL